MNRDIDIPQGKMQPTFTDSFHVDLSFIILKKTISMCHLIFELRIVMIYHKISFIFSSVDFFMG